MKQIALAFALLAYIAGAQAAIQELNRIVAVVNDDVVTAQELDRRIGEVVQQLRRQGTPMPPPKVLRKQVLERLVLERLQLERARSIGIRIDDETVNQVVGNIAEQNNLNLFQFRMVLERDGIDYAQFREDIRRQLMLDRLRVQQVNNKVNVTPREVDAFLEMQQGKEGGGEEYRLGHILIALPEAASPEQVQAARREAEEVLGKLRGGADFGQVAVAHSDGQNALEGGDLGWRKANELPTLFADAIAGMQAGGIGGPVRSPSGFHLFKVLEVRGEERHMVEQTHARHILIKTSELVSAEQARERLARLRERILAGEPFAELARANSDDKASAAEGGDLGWSNPGDLVPRFEQAMDALEPGEISEPFESRFGWHIVQVLERRQQDNTEQLERTKAAEALRQRKIEEQTQTWRRRLRDEAYVELRLDE